MLIARLLVAPFVLALMLLLVIVFTPIAVGIWVCYGESQYVNVTTPGW